MPDLIQAEILSFEVDTPDRAVLTFTAKGVTWRLAFGDCQVEFLRQVAPRIHIAMAAGRAKRLAEQEAADLVPVDLPPD
jgi:hypothetical protein